MSTISILCKEIDELESHIEKIESENEEFKSFGIKDKPKITAKQLYDLGWTVIHHRVTKGPCINLKIGDRIFSELILVKTLMEELALLLAQYLESGDFVAMNVDETKLIHKTLALILKILIKSS